MEEDSANYEKEKGEKKMENITNAEYEEKEVVNTPIEENEANENAENSDNESIGKGVALAIIGGAVVAGAAVIGGGVLLVKKVIVPGVKKLGGKIQDWKAKREQKKLAKGTGKLNSENGDSAETDSETESNE